MMDSFGDFLRNNPVGLLFLVLGLGYLVGKTRVRGFELGSVTGVLFVGQFGGYGFEQGGFTRPMGIAVAGDEVFVADVSDRIVVYGRDGEFRREFGQTGRAAGELNYPYGLCPVGSMNLRY